MIRRLCLDELNELSSYFPVVGILGPRQVGKTTLIKQFIKQSDKECIYLDLERPSDFEKLREAEYYFSSNQEVCVVIDEIQRRPELFAMIRSSVDEHRVPMRYIILGSASPEIIRHSSESLAGRISYVRLHPFVVSELADYKWREHHFRGGFPDSYLAPDNSLSQRWLDEFISSYLERDLPQLGLPATPLISRRLLTMLAWQSGNVLNASSIGKSLGLSYQTIKRYIDFLEGAFLVKQIQPHIINIKKRLVKSPKVYISDTGVLHRLIGANTYDDLLGMPQIGASFETYVMAQLLALKSRDIDVQYYRTHGGTEVDFVLTRGSKAIATLEVKYSSAPKTTKSLSISIDDLNVSKNFIIVPETDRYQKSDTLTVCSVASFINDDLPNL